MTNYRGFQIDRSLVIYRDGREMPRSWWQSCETLDDCKAVIDDSIEQQERQILSHKRNLAASWEKFLNEVEFENGAKEMEDEERRIDEIAERELLEKQ